MRKLVWSLGLAGSVLFSGSLAAAAEDLFQYNGKKYTVKDLDPKFQSKLFEVEAEVFNMKQRILEDAALDLYIADKAKKEKKTADQVREQLFKVGEPSEKDLKKFFEENKAKIPYPYEQVKNELARYVKEQKSAEARQGVIEEVKKKGGFALLAAAPVSPRVDINIAGFPTRGKNDAKVTVVEFADYKCGHCKEASKAFKDLYKKYDSKVKFVYVDFPIMSGSEAIAEGSHCAAKQEKFWDYNKTAFDEQGALKTAEEIAKKVGLDEKKFADCMKAGEGKVAVNKGKDEGKRLGISGTPAIYINGRRSTVGLTTSALEKEIEKELKGSAS